MAQRQSKFRIHRMDFNMNQAGYDETWSESDDIKIVWYKSHLNI